MDYPCPFHDVPIGEIEQPFVNVVNVISYQNFNDDALEFSRQFDDVIANGGLIAQSPEAQSIEQLFEMIWGIETFMGGILSQGGTVQGESNIPTDQRSESRARMVDWLILHTDLLNALTTEINIRTIHGCY